MRRVAAAFVLVTVAVGAWYLAGRSPRASVPGSSVDTRTTATVERRDLVERETLDGTLGFAGQRGVRASIAGTLTWVAEEGARIRLGRRLFAVDDRAVWAMTGTVPAWRPLGPGIEDGRDIRQLERSLAALGHDPDGAMDIDGTWDAATTAVVRNWQDDRGLTEDGTIDLGEIVFLPRSARVGDVSLSRGDPVGPGSQVLTASSTRRVVVLNLEATRQTLAVVGDEVEVELPDGSVVPGTIEDVGRVAQTDQGDEDSEPYVVVAIAVDETGPANAYDQAPVDVGLAVERRSDVLAVPVPALLALAEGGFALERTNGSLIAVETGLYADGWVEVSGEGVTEGLTVVTAS